jgi:hypothetical protein
MERDVLPQGNGAHIVPKYAQSGCDASPVDAEELVVNIYKKSHT